VFYCTFYVFVYNIVSGQLALLLLINDDDDDKMLTVSQKRNDGRLSINVQLS